jgi:hypothetical protein
MSAIFRRRDGAPTSEFPERNRAAEGKTAANNIRIEFYAGDECAMPAGMCSAGVPHFCVSANVSRTALSVGISQKGSRWSRTSPLNRHGGDRTTTAQGVLVFHMFSALAEFERALIQERTRAGLDAAKRAGRRGGRPPKLTEDDLGVARTLLVNSDMTVADIAGRLGVSPTTLYRYLPAAP